VRTNRRLSAFVQVVRISRKSREQEAFSLTPSKELSIGSDASNQCIGFARADRRRSSSSRRDGSIARDLTKGADPSASSCTCSDAVWRSAHNLTLFMSPAQLFVFAAVVTLYFPCIATMSVLGREMGWKDTAAIMVGDIGIAIIMGAGVFRLLTVIHLV
jgi:hypothetical protein